MAQINEKFEVPQTVAYPDSKSENVLQDEKQEFFEMVSEPTEAPPGYATDLSGFFPKKEVPLTDIE